MTHLTDSVAVVTGGARGIGAGIGAALASKGCRVVVWDQAPEAFDEAREAFKPAKLVKVDVTDWESVSAAAQATLREFGAVQILVNNAGISGPTSTPAWEYPLDMWTKVLGVNLSGAYYCSRALIPSMIERGYGRIVNIASVSAKQGGAGYVAYGTSKAGLLGLTKCLGRELAKTGVLVNAVTPTMAETDLLSQMTPEHIARARDGSPMGRLVTVAEVANMVAWVASAECSASTGAVFDVSTGISVY